MMTRRWFLKASAASTAVAAAGLPAVAGQGFTISGNVVGGGVMLSPSRIELLNFGKVVGMASVSPHQVAEFENGGAEIVAQIDVEDAFEVEGARLVVDGRRKTGDLGFLGGSKALLAGDTLTVTVHPGPRY